MYGYEIDKDMFDYSIKNLNVNAQIKNEDINLINYKDLDVDCFILNTPFLKDEMLRSLIEKIFLSKKDTKKKYYIIIINVDVILKKIKLNNIFENFKLIKFINAGPITTFRIYENLIIK